MKFIRSTFENDFVILKLGSPLKFNINVQPACLPTSNSFLGLDDTEDMCFTSGWGRLQHGKQFFQLLVMYEKLFTPSIPELIWVENVRAIVVCGFLMKFLKKHIMKI